MKNNWREIAKNWNSPNSSSPNSHNRQNITGKIAADRCKFGELFVSQGCCSRWKVKCSREEETKIVSLRNCKRCYTKNELG